MGSVKDFEVLEEPTRDSVGHAIFHFSDRYSVFDWGPMPENIERKGEVLALMGAYTFEALEDRGISTHYMGMEEDGEIKSVEELESASNRMHVKFVNVVEPEFSGGSYDYSALRDSSLTNYLVPLEIVFRNSVPIGSSARRRYTLQDLGLDMEEWPEEAVSLEEPIVESSTKLEEQDRYIGEERAEEIAGAASLEEMYEITRKANKAITERAEEVGMKHDDGKLEFLYIQGEVAVGDVAGTFDEDRFTYDGMQVSKEVLRQAYKEDQPAWVEEVGNAKEEAKEEGIEKWKDLVATDPRPLGIEGLVSEMYRAGANRYIGRDFFEARDLGEVMEYLEDMV